MFSGIVNRFTVTIWLASSVVAAVAGPFGTHASMSVGLRTVYWSSAIALSIFVAHGLRAGLNRWWPGLSRNGQDMIVPPVFSMFFSALIDGVNHALLQPGVHDVGHLAMFLLVLALSIMVTLLRRFLEADAPLPVPEVPDNPVQTPQRKVPLLYKRVDAGPGVRIQRLTVADHYVSVFLSDGTCQKLLMRFSDAVDEMAGQPGLCTHRSHWVSCDVVSGVIRDGGREFVVLNDGTRLPLTRTYRTGFENSGLVARPPAGRPISAE
jgi:hypothetical protein